MRIIEVSAFVAAPSGGMALAQLGAEVIRIDPPGGGLDYRRWPVTGSNASLFWAGLNKGKKSVVIDILHPEGRELAQALIGAPGPDAGILLTNMPPRGWLDYESLKRRREDLIQLTVMGDRHGGSAVDYTLNARLGFPLLTGPATRDGVVNHVLPAWDLITGQMAAVGLLVAERYRRLHSAGQHIRLPLEDVGLSVMGHLGFIAEAEAGGERGRYENDLFGAFGRDFLTRDKRRIMVVALTHKQWRALCRALAMESQVADLAQRRQVDLSLEGERFRAREAIADIVRDKISRIDYGGLAERFRSCGVCWGLYQSVPELVREDRECSPDNPMFSHVTQPGIGQTLTPASALNSSVGRLPARPAPVLGQHTEAVLADLLGIGSGQIGQYIDRGLIARSPGDA
ncbi:MAG: CoA transferase [Parahaliea sp.]